MRRCRRFDERYALRLSRCLQKAPWYYFQGWEREVKRAANIDLELVIDFATVLFDNGSRNVQAKARASAFAGVRAVGLGKSAKNILSKRLGYSRPMIGDRDPRSATMVGHGYFDV